MAFAGGTSLSQPAAADRAVITSARSMPAKSPSGASTGMVSAVPAEPPPTRNESGRQAKYVSMTKPTLEASETRPSMACGHRADHIGVGHDHRDAAGERHEEGRGGEIDYALDDGLGYRLFAEPGDQPDHGRHDEEKGRKLWQPPAELPPQRRMDRRLRVEGDRRGPEDRAPGNDREPE